MSKLRCPLLSFTVFACAACAFAADDNPKASAENLFPASTLAAVIVPDLAAARAAAGKTRLAEMYAQPDMQAFLAPALAQIKKSYNELRAKNALLPTLDDVDIGLFGSEIAVAVYARGGDPDLPAGLVATLAPKDPEAFKRLFPANLRAMMIDGLVIPLGGEPKDAAVTFNSGRVIFCVPQSDIGQVLKRLKDPAARAAALGADAGFAAVRNRLSASAAYIYVAPKKLVETVLANPRAELPFDPALARALLGAAGVLNANGAGVGVGFSATDPICEAFLNFAAPPKDDLFALFNTQTPVSAEGLKIAAPDAPYVAGGYMHFGGLVPFLQTMADKAGPEAAAAFNQLQDLSRKTLGFDIHADLLANLGGEIVVAQTVVDTGAPLTFAPGLVMSIPVKDAAKVEDCVQKLGAVFDHARDALAGPEKLIGPRLKRLEYHGKTIYYFSGGEVLAGPVALTFSGSRVLVCSSYNAARRGIEQFEANSDILSNMNFQWTIARVSGKAFDAKALPSSFAYSIDRGSGTSELLVTGLGLTAATAALGGFAELPTVPVDAANANGINIPANEAAAVQTCINFAEAEEIYHRTDYTGNGVLKFAQSLKGDNSLLERKAGAGDIVLVEKAMADAEGDPGDKTSKRGYRFKVLKGQGQHAAGGARDFVANGQMTLGYALAAYPAEYGVTGKRTFIINNSGVVFGKDLGAETDAAVKAMTVFDPDPTWTEAVEEQPPAPPRFGGGNEFQQFLSRPSGKTVLTVLNSIDLGLWPDEGFFIKYRRPTGAMATLSADGVYWRSELPPPGPSSSLGINPTMMVAGVAVVAAVAIPSLLRSRMAANETAAAAACKAFAEGEEIYHRTDYTGNGVLKYAQSLHDMYETKPGAGDIALVDRNFMNAEATGANPVPKAGYYFKVLTAQGPAATGGKRSYIAGGNMTLGYALVAYPAAYDSTGRDTFIISNNGTIFQKDIGADTKAQVEAMTEFNPDETWVPTQ